MLHCIKTVVQMGSDGADPTATPTFSIAEQTGRQAGMQTNYQGPITQHTTANSTFEQSNHLQSTEHAGGPGSNRTAVANKQPCTMSVGGMDFLVCNTQRELLAQSWSE